MLLVNLSRTGRRKMHGRVAGREAYGPSYCTDRFHKQRTLKASART